MASNDRGGAHTTWTRTRAAYRAAPSGGPTWFERIMAPEISVRDVERLDAPPEIALTRVMLGAELVYSLGTLTGAR